MEITSLKIVENATNTPSRWHHQLIAKTCPWAFGWEHSWVQLLTFMDILGKKDINSSNSSFPDSYFQIGFLGNSDIKMLDLGRVLSPECSETHLPEKYTSMDIFLLSSAATPVAPEHYCPNSTTVWGFKHSYQDTELRMLWEEIQNISGDNNILATLSLTDICMVSCFDTATQSLSWMDTAHFLQKRSCNLVE